MRNTVVSRLLSWTNSFFSREHVLLDIGSANLKLLAGTYVPGPKAHFRLSRYRISGAPPELEHDYSLVHKGTVRRLTAAITRLTDEIGLSGSEVSVSFYEPFARLVTFEVPSEEGPDELEVLNRLKEKSALPDFDSREWSVDWVVLESGKETTVIAEGVELDKIIKLEECVRAAGMNPVRMSAAITCGFESFSRCIPVLGRGSIALVNLGNLSTSVAIFYEGIPRFLATLGTGGVHFTRQIARARGISGTEAALYKERSLFFLPEWSQEQYDVENFRLIKPVVMELLASLFYLFEHYFNLTGEERLEKIILAGGGACFANIDVLFENNLKTETIYAADVLSIKGPDGCELENNTKNILACPIGALMEEEDATKA